MTKRDFGAALAALAISLPLAPAHARLAEGDPLSGIKTIERSELCSLRGGMMIGGFQVDFAVVVRTTLEGASGPLGLQTTLSVNDAGRLSNAVTTAIGNGPGSGATVTTMGGPMSATGLAMMLKGNETAIMQQVVNGQLQSLLSNRAGNVTVSHSTDVNVTLPGLQAITQGWVGRLQASRQAYDAAIVGLGR